jgi:hypothetical protein
MPHPQVQMVLSTSWAQEMGLAAAVAQLPEALRERVVGATYELAQPGDYFRHLSRGEQVLLDVQRRQPSAWVALDDDRVGWPTWAEENVVFTDPYEGLSAPEVQQSLRTRLAAITRSTHS